MNEQTLKLDRRPQSGSFELTVRCNLHCKMCLFRHDDSEIPNLIAREKTVGEWIDMGRQAAEAGTLDLTVTGGEPLLRKDFPEIWEGLAKVGFILTLYTNATLVTPELMNLFHQYPPHRIGVTLYGASEETYQSVTGNGKAYHRAINGIAQLRTLPSIIDFRTTIIKDNLHDIERMEAYVKEGFGDERKLTHTVMVFKPVRGGCAKVEACRLDAGENTRLYFERQLKDISERAEKAGITILRGSFTKKSERSGTSKPKTTFLGCDAGIGSYTISWDGKMLGCQLLGQYQTEPFQTGFRRAWDVFPSTITSTQAPTVCAKCKYKDQCLSCYASRQAETDGKEECPAYICQNVEQMAKYIENQEEKICEERV